MMWSELIFAVMFGSFCFALCWDNQLKIELNHSFVKGASHQRGDWGMFMTGISTDAWTLWRWRFIWFYTPRGAYGSRFAWIPPKF